MSKTFIKLIVLLSLTILMFQATPAIAAKPFQPVPIITSTGSILDEYDGGINSFKIRVDYVSIDYLENVNLTYNDTVQGEVYQPKVTEIKVKNALPGNTLWGGGTWWDWTGTNRYWEVPAKVRGTDTGGQWLDCYIRVFVADGVSTIDGSDSDKFVLEILSGAYAGYSSSPSNSGYWLQAESLYEGSITLN